MNRSSFLKRLGLIAVGIAIAPTAAFTKSNQWVAYKFSATTIKVSEELLNGASCDVMNAMTRLLAERMAIVLKREGGIGRKIKKVGRKNVTF